MDPFSGTGRYWRLFRGKHRNGGFLGAIDTFSGLIVLFGNFLGAKEAFSGLIVLFGNFLGAMDTFSGQWTPPRGGSAFLPLFRGKHLPSLGLHMIALLIPGYVPSPLVNSCI